MKWGKNEEKLSQTRERSVFFSGAVDDFSVTSRYVIARAKWGLNWL